jgi:2-iminobutanoate/2-iminopropanoate deaminase
MKLQSINTDKAPKAIGPYSQAIKIEDLIFTSGQIPLDPQSGVLISGNIKDASIRALENLKAVLIEAGSSLEKIVKVTVFLSDMSNFSAFNEVYGIYFENTKPARSCVEVSKLPKDALVEIEAIAVMNSGK